MGLLAQLALSPLQAAEPLQVLYFGDNGHHKPAERFRQLQETGVGGGEFA